MSASTDIHRSLDALWRIESPRLIATLARMTGDVSLAEELAHDAMVTALEQWPTTGIPEQPGAWLMTTAKRRAIDQLRRKSLHLRKEGDLTREIEGQLHATQDAPDTVADDLIGDDLLRLMFVACHPVLSREARVALTLRLLGGLTVEEIARAYLTQESTIAQRIVRAKRTLTEKNIAFEVPHGDALPPRLDSVLESIYLIFNEGYAATTGEDLMRPSLCEDALRLGRMLAQLLPREPEVHGLVALMELQASRTGARIGAQGEPVLLLEQDRSRWDQLLIRRGLASLEHAAQLGNDIGSYALQAAIAACHARAAVAEDTDWRRITFLYGMLISLSPSPVIELNRAVAMSMAFGPQAGLALVDRLRHDPALKGYHLLPTVRGDLLEKLGRIAEAREEFKRAATLTSNGRERRILLERALRCEG